MQFRLQQTLTQQLRASTATVSVSKGLPTPVAVTLQNYTVEKYMRRTADSENVKVVLLKEPQRSVRTGYMYIHGRVLLTVSVVTKG